MSERGSRLLHALDYYLGVPLLRGCALFIQTGRMRRKLPNAERLKSIALLSLGAIGDLLLMSALTRALKQRLPESRVTLITTKANACAAPLVPGIDLIRSFGLTELPFLLSFLRQQSFDLLIDSSQWARLGALVSLFAKAWVTIGFETRGEFRSSGYTYTVLHRSDQHECENFLDLGRIFFPDLNGAARIKTVSELGYTQDDCVQFCAKVLHGAQKPFFLHMWPSGVHAELKEWPAAYWAELGTILTERGGTLFFTGAKKDQEKTEAFLKAHPKLHALSLAGLVSLQELVLLFGQARAVISVNTGIMHLSALSNALTIALHGPTNPLRWGPVGERVVNLQPRSGNFGYLDLGFEYKPPYRPCLPHLLVSDVVRALEEQGAFRDSVQAM